MVTQDHIQDMTTFWPRDMGVGWEKEERREEVRSLEVKEGAGPFSFLG